MGNQAEYLPEKAIKNKDYFDNRSNDIIIQSGSAEINIISDNVPDLTFEANISEKTTIELPRLYYMGYTLKLNDKTIELTESENGFLQATIDESGTYVLTYSKTTVMKIANILSLGTFIFIIVFIINLKRKKRKEIYLLNDGNKL